MDDLQWAEPTFLDLVEHVADLSRDAPIFLLCVTRMELLDGRPGWGGGKLNATSLLLEPLAGERMRSADRATSWADTRLDAEHARAHHSRRRKGTPSTSRRCSRWCVSTAKGPRSSCRRRSMRCSRPVSMASTATSASSSNAGAVEGEVFHRGSVVELAPPPVQPAVESHLVNARSQGADPCRQRRCSPDDEAFRFRHLLIRDAAYESLPKATRAELHERFADWLATHEPRRARRDPRLPPRAGAPLPQPSSTPKTQRFRRSPGRASDHLASAGKCCARPRRLPRRRFTP